MSITAVQRSPGSSGPAAAAIRCLGLCLCLANLAGQAAAQPKPADPRAILAQAVAADLGRGAAQDAARAFHLYSLAAEAGLREAQLNVAVMLDSGRGAAQDTQAAATYYAMAAVQGEPRAAYDLGQLYFHGEGVPANAELARAWLSQAGAEGITAAARLLAALQVPASAASGELAAPHPSHPLSGAAQPAGAPVIFVWTEGRQPASSMFYVEVASLETASPGDVFTAMTTLSAASWPGASPGRYAWRVFTVCQPLGRYLPSPWIVFSVV